ncbi:MAG: type II toxin-antitoxin system VapC family toxin [Crocosphaera sp.]
MNILLDTHIFLWFVNDDPRLSDAFKDLIENENNFSSPGHAMLKNSTGIVLCWVSQSNSDCDLEENSEAVRVINRYKIYT